MSLGQKILWAVVIAVILIGGYWWWSSSQSSNALPQGAATNSQAPMIPATSAGGQTGSPNPNASASVGVSASAGVASASGNAAPMTATVTFNGSSFSPSNVTIAQGGTVTWTSTNGPFWVASDPHPIHNGYDGTTQQQHCAPGYAGAAPFDQCSSGTTFSFTFTKVGTWGYHDHFSATSMGSVTVVAQ